MKLDTKRYDWIDCLKLLAVYSVYLCHAPGLGRIGILAISFQLPCFFFASGFFAKNGQKYGVREFITNKFLRIMVPYFAFSLLSLAMRVVFFEYSLGQIIEFAGDMLYASRTRVAVTALWFFPCLFFMAIFYYFLRKLIKNPILLTVICFGLSAAVKLIREEPVAPWGIDMAVRFLIYYCIGDMVRRVIEDGRLLSFFRHRGYLAIPLVTAVTLLSCYLIYINYYYSLGYFYSLAGVTPSYVMTSIEQFLYNIVYLSFGIIASLVLCRFTLICKMGAVSAAIMGVEQIIKNIIPLLFTSIGISFPDLQTPPEAMVLSAVYVLAAYLIFAAPINRNLPELLGKKFKRSV